jgi:hypothetical protein
MSTDFPQGCQDHSMGKDSLLGTDATTAYPHAKE